MRSHTRLLLALAAALFAAGTFTLAQEVTPAPPPVPPLPDQQSMVPPPVPTQVPADAAPVVTPLPASTATNVDTSVVLGKVPTSKSRSEKKAQAAAKKREEVDKALRKAPEAATAAAVAVSGNSSAPPPAPPASGTGSPAPAVENAAPPPIADVAPGDVSAKADAQPPQGRKGGLWLLFAIFVIAAIGMTTFVVRRSAGGVKELSILPGSAVSQPRSPLASGRHL